MSRRSPRVSERKGHRPRVPVLPQIDQYQRVMNIVLKAITVRDTEHAKNLREALYVTADSVFKCGMAQMEKYRPSKDDELHKKIQFNDSVTRLRTVHNQVLIRIRALEPKKEEVYEDVAAA
jgi:hypothetical protein